MQDDIDSLVEAAVDAVNAGDSKESERLWLRILEIDPQHSVALCGLGIQALQRGDSSTALDYLSRANASAPADIMILMNLATACRQQGEVRAEREALDNALTVNPSFVPALLQKAQWMERNGTLSAALNIYKGALLFAPREEHWPAEYRDQLKYAQEFARRHADALFKHLHQALDIDVRQLDAPLKARWREAVAIRAGIANPTPSLPNQLFVPRLPAIPFFDRSGFPFIRELELQTPAIRMELAELIAKHSGRFVPMIELSPGEPVEQWRELDRSMDWSAFYLWRNGSPVEEHLELCPRTADAIRSLPLAEIEGISPNVHFCSVQPRTHIPPHNGESNARVVGHLPLLVADKCLLRVGFEEREWSIGETLVFDDTLAHEALNDSDELLVVLVFDLWNPLLTAADRELSNALSTATRQFLS